MLVKLASCYNLARLLFHAPWQAQEVKYGLRYHSLRLSQKSNKQCSSADYNIIRRAAVGMCKVILRLEALLKRYYGRPPVV